MKKIPAISLLFLALVPAFQLNLIYSFYQLNKSYIARNFCINLDRPEIMCYGRCYINKVISKTEDKNSGFPAPGNQEKFSTFIFTAPVSDQLPLRRATVHKRELPEFACFYSFGFNLKIFHPPQV